MRKILNFLKNFLIIAYILLIIFVTICLLSYNDYRVTVLGSNTILPVIDEDLEPEYSVGDLLIIQKNKLSTVKEGDKIFFYMKRFGEVTVNYSTVTSTERVSDTEVTYTVEGNYKFSSSNFIGKVDTAIVIPEVGRILSILQSKWGFLFLGVFPSLLTFLYTLHSVIGEFIGDDENDEENKASSKKKENVKIDSKDKEDNTKQVEYNKEEKTFENKKEDTKDEPKEKAEEVAKEKIDEKTEENKEVVVKENVENVATKTEETKTDEITVSEVKEEKKEEVTDNKEETKKEDVSIEKSEQEKIKEQEEKKKAAIEARMKSMTEEEKKALIKAKLDSMTDEEKRALIEAKKKKLEAEKNKKGDQ